MMELQKPYQTRPVRFLELWQESSWKIKVYGIAYQRPYPRLELIEAAKAVARSHLGQPANGEQRYGVGILGVHDGRSGSFVFVDYWADDTELYHHYYIAPSNKPTLLKSATPTELTFCVWNLRIMGFESQVWVDTVLTNPAGPDLEKYLAYRLNEDI